MKSNSIRSLVSISALFGLLMASSNVLAGNQQDKNALAAAETAGKAVAGAVTDAYREGQIWATYAVNPKLNTFNIDADVKGDQVTLTGVVESLSDRRLAERIAARMEGINKVDNRLSVDPMLVVTTVVTSEPSYAVFVSDATLESMIESKLLWNEYTDALDINVQSSAGVVTLTGKADTESSRTLAAALAASTPGVALVSNLLTVDKESGQVAKVDDGDKVLSDSWIAAKVRSTLHWDSSIDSREFKISSDHGVVTVAGEVATAAERQRAIEATQHIRGVKRVDASGLTVEANADSVAQR